MKKVVLLFTLASTVAIINVTAQSTDPAPYCVADFDDDPFNVPNAINSVEFGTLNNVTNDQYEFPHYVFYNNLEAPDVTKGEEYTLTVSFTANGGCGYGVWIDWNQDNIFDESERISGTPSDDILDISDNTVITETITIPASALDGETRMRVRIVEDDNFTMGPNGYAILPCNEGTSPDDVMDWGETEDYVINITSAVGVNSIKEDNSLIVSPNPATSTLNVKYDITNEMNYKIVNISGQEIKTGILNTNDKNINVSKLATGMYFLQIYDNNGTVAQQKFIKKTE